MFQPNIESDRWALITDCNRCNNLRWYNAVITVVKELIYGFRNDDSLIECIIARRSVRNNGPLRRDSTRELFLLIVSLIDRAIRICRTAGPRMDPGRRNLEFAGHIRADARTTREIAVVGGLRIDDGVKLF